MARLRGQAKQSACQAIDETQPNLGIGILRIGKIMGKRYSISFNRKIEAITRTSSIERNVVTIRHVVKQLLIKLSLPSYILPNVIRDYRKLAERGGYRARLRETAVALTYLNCKKEGIPAG